MSRAPIVVRWAPVLFAMAVFMVLGAEPPSRLGILSTIWDKAVHAAGYGVLGVLALRAVAGTVRESGAAHMGIAAALSLGHGATLEIMQAAIPWRDGSWGDLLADAVGFGMAMVAVRTWIALTRGGVREAEGGS